MNKVLQLLIVVVMALGFNASAHALIIESIALENSFFEVLASEILENGSIAALERPSAGIDGVTNIDPVFFGREDETDEQLRSRGDSTIVRASYRVLMNDIEAISDRVYTIDSEAGTVIFGNGVTGARPPSGRSALATYNYGGGAEGNIIQSYTIDPNNFSPFLIPKINFPTDEQGNIDFSFVIFGIQSIDLVLSSDGLLIANVQPQSVPEPPTLLLLAAGLAGLVCIRSTKNGLKKYF